MVVWSVQDSDMKDSEEPARWRDWRFVMTVCTIALAIAASAAVLLAAGSG